MSEKLRRFEEDQCRVDEMLAKPYIYTGTMGGIQQHMLCNPGPPPIHDALPDDTE